MRQLFFVLDINHRQFNVLAELRTGGAETNIRHDDILFSIFL